MTVRVLAGGGGSEVARDDDFNLVTALYHFNGSGGGQNATFTDSSNENHTVTKGSMHPRLGSFSPFSKDEGKWSWNWPVGGNYNKLKIASSADFAFGTGAFTIEAWVYVTADTNPYSRVWHLGPYWNDNNAIGLVVNDTASSDKIAFCVYAAGGRTCVSTNATPMNQWTHIACVRDSSGNFKLFVNGNLDATNTSYTSTNISPGGNQTFCIGNIVEDNNTLEAEGCFEGYISGVRVTKGTALYSSTFTVPTSPAVYQDTNTKLLTCQSNRIKDNNTNSTKTLTMKSTVKVSPFSPFANSTAYTAATRGGSALFEQNANSYLEVDDATDFDFGTSDHCIEAWLYPTQTSFSNSWAMWFATKGVNQYWGYTDGAGNEAGAGFSAYPSGAYSANNDHILKPFTWNHCVFQVTGGYENWYLNGTRIYNVQNNPNYSSSATGVRIGNSPSYPSFFYYGGYISDLRVTTGNNYNPYSNSATLTVPTAPLTKGSYTKLLLNMTDADIFDHSATANMERYGSNTSLSTSIKKFGTSSVNFGSSGNAMLIIRDTTVPIGTAPFTIEFFMKTNTSSQDGVAYRRPFKTGTGPVSNNILELFINTGNGTGYGTTQNLAVYTNALNITGTSNIADNNWHHVAVTRDTSNNLRLFVDGTQEGSTASSYTNNLNTDDHMLGRYRGDGLQGGEYVGYIDELRITVGKARYTSNFTAPTEEFLNN